MSLRMRVNTVGLPLSNSMHPVEPTRSSYHDVFHQTTTMGVSILPSFSLVADTGVLEVHYHLKSDASAILCSAGTYTCCFMLRFPLFF